MRRPSARSYSTWLRCCSPDKHAAQFARTHRLRRKLSEPRNAGHRTEASFCSQRMTSDADSESISAISNMCPQTHGQIKKSQRKIAKNQLFYRLNRVSRQKLDSAVFRFEVRDRTRDG